MNAQDYVGKVLTEAETNALLKAQPVCSTETDVYMRTAALTFSFGPGGVKLVEAERRVPKRIRLENGTIVEV